MRLFWANHKSQHFWQIYLLQKVRQARRWRGQSHTRYTGQPLLASPVEPQATTFVHGGRAGGRAAKAWVSFQAPGMRCDLNGGSKATGGRQGVVAGAQAPERKCVQRLVLITPVCPQANCFPKLRLGLLVCTVMPTLPTSLLGCLCNIEHQTHHIGGA